MAIAPLLTINQLNFGVRLTQMNVRVVHKWTRPEFKDKKKTDAIELLFVDSENEVIQATIRRQLIGYFGPKLSIGMVYTIRNLTVDNNTGLDKATPHRYRLKFEFSSQVHATNDASIPIHGYRFANFKDIIDGIVPHTHYIDIIGKLYEIGPITETTNKHKCRTIKLEDFEGNQISCTLWEPHTVELPALISQLPNPEQSKIIVIQCVQTKRFEGLWRIQTTFNATVFNVNPDIPEVNDFEPSLLTPAKSNSLQIIEIPDDEDDDDISRDNIKSISDIKENEKAGYYYTYAKIVNLDCTAGWYYDSCKLCWAKSIKNDKGRWVCTRDGCDGHVNGFMSRVPRFQVKFEVSDPSDDVADFVVFDTHINQFITPTATELLAKIEKSGGEQEDIPRELEYFLDKSFVFKVNIHEKYNVSQGSNSYTVSSMSDDADLKDKWLTKYTEMFKEEFHSFKSRATPLVVAEHAKALIDIIDAEQEEKSQTADSSPKITPLKRPNPTNGDASSSTKKNVIVKKEN